MGEAYDLAVIGSGPGGYAAALTAARRGLRTCLIEREQIGGGGPNVGCIPTKAPLAASPFGRRLQRAGELGVTIAGYTVDFAAVRARNERIVATLRKGLTDLLQREGVELVAGTAAFEGATQLAVASEGGARRVNASRIVLATGGRPVPGPWAFDERRLLSYRGLLAMTTRPASLLIIGGGPIGCEFASCFAAFGTRVTLIEQQPQLLPGEDPEAVRWLVRRFAADGITVLTDTTVQRLDVTTSGVTAQLSTGQTMAAERCLIAVGQQPNIDSLRLDAASVAHGRGIRVDAFLRTNQPHMAAIGDCLEQPHGFAHWASAEGALAVRNLLGDPPESLEPRDVPHCTFTDPEITHIGVREADAEGAVRVSRLSFAALGKSHCDDETEGFVKLLVDPATDQVRGATIVGANASSLIHQAVLAIRHGMTAKQLARTITAHPTQAEAVTEAAAHLYGESLAVAARPAARARG